MLTVTASDWLHEKPLLVFHGRGCEFRGSVPGSSAVCGGLRLRGRIADASGCEHLLNHVIQERSGTTR